MSSSGNPYFPTAIASAPAAGYIYTSTASGAAFQLDGGFHTGTLTNVNNVASFSGQQGFYYRIGNFVVVQIRNLAITPTGSINFFNFRQTLPIASNVISATNNIMGVVSGSINLSGTQYAITGRISHDGTNNEAYYQVFVNGISMANPFIVDATYTYRIV